MSETLPNMTSQTANACGPSREDMGVMVCGRCSVNPRVACQGLQRATVRRRSFRATAATALARCWNVKSTRYSSTPLTSQETVIGIRSFLVGTRSGRVLLTLPRAWFALSICLRPVRAIGPWLWRSREFTNFSYDLTEDSQRALAHGVALAANVPMSAVWRYVEELREDTELHSAYARRARLSSRRWAMDEVLRLSRRLAYYLAVRALRPRCVVEAGVDKGLGALLMLRALERNAQEGHFGRYVGLEWNSEQQADLIPPELLAAFGELRYGDSVKLLAEVGPCVDIFVHDTSPLPAHVRAQWTALGERLSSHCMVLSPWTTQDFFSQAEAQGCHALVLHDEPVQHWHPGSRLFLAFRHAKGPGRSGTP